MQINTTVTRRTIDDLPRIVDLLKDLGIVMWSVFFLVPTGRGKQADLVTHDIGVHANVTDRLGIMYAGRLVEEGSTVDVIRNPRHPYTAHLVSSLPRIGDLTQKKGLEGSPPNLAAPPPGCRFHPRCPLAIDLCRKEHPPMVGVAAGHRVACWVTAPPAQGAMS